MTRLRAISSLRLLAKAALAVASATFCLASTAHADYWPTVYQSGVNPFTKLVGGDKRASTRQGPAPVDRYVLASDDRTLLLQSFPRTARIQFLCSASDRRLGCVVDPAAPTAEIHLVTVVRGPRGDWIYKNADGDTVVRIAAYGGATVFWPGAPQGFAASKSFGDMRALTLPRADFAMAQRRAERASALISAMINRQIYFDIATMPHDGDAAVLADAVVRTARGVRDVADDPTGARILAERMKVVRFKRGLTARAAFEGDALIITYVPNKDIEGRLSSRAVEIFLEESL